MGHEVEGLQPLERQTYLRAEEELTARREAVRGKRQATKMDTEILHGEHGE